MFTNTLFSVFDAFCRWKTIGKGGKLKIKIFKNMVRMNKTKRKVKELDPIPLDGGLINSYFIQIVLRVLPPYPALDSFVPPPPPSTSNVGPMICQ